MDISPELAPHLEGLKVTPYPLVSETSRFDLSFDIFQHEGEFSVSIEYNTDLFSAERAKEIGADLTDIVQKVVAKSELQIGQLL